MVGVKVTHHQFREVLSLNKAVAVLVNRLEYCLKILLDRAVVEVSSAHNLERLVQQPQVVVRQVPNILVHV